MKALGIDLGGTKIAAAIVEEGVVLARGRVPTPSTGFVDVVGAMHALAETLLDDGGPVERVGIGSPGPLDHATGRIVFAPNIPGMDDAPIVAALEDRLRMPVVLENDANAAGYAEHRYGAAKAMDSSVYVTLSTGIGGALFVGDRVIRGANGIAGEIGHMTVLPGGPVGGDGIDGSLEALAAGRSIARDASYVYGRAMSTADTFDLAKAGDPKAVRIVDGAARFIGIGIANLVKVFDPSGFVVGGGMVQVGDFFLERIEAAAADYLRGWPMPQIVVATLGADAGVIGAAAVAVADAAGAR